MRITVKVLKGEEGQIEVSTRTDLYNKPHINSPPTNILPGVRGGDDPGR